MQYNLCIENLNEGEVYMEVKKKKIICKILSAALILCVAAGTGAVITDGYITQGITANAADYVATGECGENLTYEIEFGDYVWDEGYHLRIIGTGDMYDDFNFSTVFSTYLASEITEVYIKNGVTNISSKAFEDFTNLERVSIPNSIKSIGYGAFSYCKSLKEIIPKKTALLWLIMVMIS